MGVELHLPTESLSVTVSSWLGPRPKKKGDVIEAKEEGEGSYSSTYLVFFPIQLMDYVVAFLIDDTARHRVFFQLTHVLNPTISLMISSFKSSKKEGKEEALLHRGHYTASLLGSQATHTMRTVLHNLRRVPEAPLAHVQPFGFPAAYEVLRVERRVPRFDVEVAEEEVRDAALH